MTHIGNSRRKFFDGRVLQERLASGEKQLADRMRCGKCGRLLPGSNGICTACLRRWRTFTRIAGFLAPYRKQVALLFFASIVISAAGLLPPLITGRLVDRVLLHAAQ